MPGDEQRSVYLLGHHSQYTPVDWRIIGWLTDQLNVQKPYIFPPRVLRTRKDDYH
jgi:hypothetical protein